MKPIKLLLLVLGSVWSLGLWAQRYNFRPYSIENDLPRSGVFSVFEDSRGYLWIATEGGGVARFDGLDIKVFTTQDGLCSNSIVQVFEDSEHTLWFASEDNGISRYDGRRFSTINKDNGLSNNTVRCITEDHAHNIYLGTEGGGVCRFSLYNIRPGSSPIIAPVEISLIRKKNGLPHDVVRALAVDRNGIVWIGTDNGLSAILNGRLVNYGVADGLPNRLVQCIFVDNTNMLWIGTEGGAAHFDGERFTTFTKADGLISNNINSIVQSGDKESTIWFGSQDGISLWANGHYTNLTEREGLSSSRVRGLYRDSFGNIWISTRFGGVMKYSGNLFSTFTQAEGLPNNQITALATDSTGRVWLGSWSGVATIDTYTSHVESVQGWESGTQRVGALYLDALGRMWVASSDALSVLTTEAKPKLIKRYEYPGVKAIVMRNDTTMWLGTQSGVLYLPFSNFKKLENLPATLYGPDDGMNGQDVSDIAIDKMGNLWFGFLDGTVTVYSGSHYLSLPSFSKLKNVVSLEARGDSIMVGTKNSGLFVYRYEKNGALSQKYAHYDAHNGLASDQISLMLFDRKNQLWLGTRNGIEQLHFGRRFSSKHYGFQEGFSGIETLDNAATIDSEGNIWFGTVKGAIRLNHNAELNDPTECRLHLTEIKLGYRSLNWDEVSYASGTQTWFNVPTDLELPYDERSITFEFRGLSYRQPEKVTYRWKLEGFDTDWSPATPSNHVTYSNLPPGEYTFKLISANSDGIWNKHAVNYTFRVKKPFWHTVTFYIFIAAAITLIFIIGYQIKLQRLARDKRALEHQVEQRTRELIAEKELALSRKNQIEQKNLELLQRNSEITSSLQYAYLIQSRILDNDCILSELFPNSFIIFQPKDIVSGDFYWFRRTQNSLYIAAADCTGHGVPGAFMSIVGHNALEAALNEIPHASPNQVLKRVNTVIYQTLNQAKDESRHIDGIDMALCRISLNHRMFEYAGAMRPLLRVRKGSSEAEKFQPNRLSLGESQDDVQFTNHTIIIEPGDRIYLFSDGYTDQFGGDSGKKYLNKRFYQFLAATATMPMPQQQRAIMGELIQWAGMEEQVDDILVIGIEL